MKNTVIDPLPGPTRARLEQTLAQWRHWRCERDPGSRPEPVEVLGSGISNVSVLVAARERLLAFVRAGAKENRIASGSKGSEHL